MRNKEKISEKNRVWDGWQRYVKKEIQRLKQKSGGNVVHEKSTGRQPVKPTEEPARTEAEHPVHEETEHMPHVQVEGVPREEDLRVGDDYIGRTPRPFTVDDYRRIRPMNLLGDEEAAQPYVPEDIPEDIPEAEEKPDVENEYFELLISDEFKLTERIPVKVYRYSDGLCVISSDELNLYAQGDSEYLAKLEFSDVLIEDLEDLEEIGTDKLGRALKIRLSMLKRLLKRI